MSAIWRGRIVIGCIVVCLVAASAAGPASAGCISQTFGNTTIHNCDGKISASHTVGETTVHNFDGKLGTSQTVGNTTVHNLGNKLGTSHTVGHDHHAQFRRQIRLVAEIRQYRRT